MRKAQSIGVAVLVMATGTAIAPAADASTVMIGRTCTRAEVGRVLTSKVGDSQLRCEVVGTRRVWRRLPATPPPTPAPTTAAPPTTASPTDFSPFLQEGQRRVLITPDPSTPGLTPMLAKSVDPCPSSIAPASGFAVEVIVTRRSTNTRKAYRYRDAMAPDGSWQIDFRNPDMSFVRADVRGPGDWAMDFTCIGREQSGSVYRVTWKS